MKTYAHRILPDQELLEELLKFTKQNSCVLTCVGSLKKAHLRLAFGAGELIKDENETYEIVSLVGTVDPTGTHHLHISLSDKKGARYTFGGHLMPGGNIIYTTAEIVIGEVDGVVFSREQCQLSGWPELIITPQNQLLQQQQQQQDQGFEEDPKPFQYKQAHPKWQLFGGGLYLGLVFGLFLHRFMKG